MRNTMTAAAAALAALVATAAGAQEGPGDMMGGFHGRIDVVVIDADGNGSLSRAELQARATERLARFDANGDGSLDRDELIAAFPAPSGGMLNLFSADPAERMVDRLIALMGGTEAGRIDVAALADRRVNAILAVADTDRDAAISVAEADAAAERMERGPWHRPGHGRGPDAGPDGGPGDGPRGDRDRDGGSRG